MGATPTASVSERSDRLHGYRQTAMDRAAELKTRLIFGMLGTPLFAAVVSPAFGAIWGLAVAITQMLDHAAAAPFRDLARTAEPTLIERIRVMASSAATTSVYGSSVVFVWFGWNPYGPEFASFMIAGMMLHVVLLMHHEREIFIAAFAPYVVIFFAVPLLYGFSMKEGVLSPALGLLLPMTLFMGHLMKAYSAQRTVFWELLKDRERERGERAQAEAANRAKDSFLAMMSHELRTPLNGVMGAAQALERENLTSEQSGLVKVLRSSGSLLLAVIDDILDFSKIEAGKLALEDGVVSLRELADHVDQLWRPSAEEKGLQFKVLLADKSDVVMRGDPTRLRQIVFNLVSNAIKFTQEGSVVVRIDIEPRCEERSLVIAVEDTGPGVPERVADRLFEAFEQADSSTTRKHGGTGLGLPISRKLARLMGGDVHLDAAYESGSRFVVTAPFQPAAARPKEQRPAFREAATPERAIKVLLAEDLPINRQIIEVFLRDEPIDLKSAENGAVALDILATEDFDLVLMDVQMPVMDGMEATRTLRASGGANAETPVIALTANAMADQRRQCLEAGMTDHLAKPINRDDLISLVMRYGRGEKPSPAEAGAPRIAEGS